MDTIVVGVDTSSTAAAALRWAGRVATDSGAEVVAVNAFTEPYAEVDPETHDRLVDEEHDWLTARVEALADTGVKVRTVVREGDPRNTLLPVAMAEGADLLVVGRTGEGGGPGFLHVGSVVEHVIHHSEVPLAVIPGGHDAAPAGGASGLRVLLGLDGSEGSHHTVTWLAELARSRPMAVTAVSVEEPFLEWTRADSPDNWRRDAERHLEDWTGPLREAGADVEVLAVRDMHPSAALLGTAARRRAELVVVGTRGIHGFTGLRLGGTALKVLHHAERPVVIVPAP